MKCNHTFKQHQMMEEAKASAELEGIKTDKTICQLLDILENFFTNKKYD